jgi:hypothetical protein
LRRRSRKSPIFIRRLGLLDIVFPSCDLLFPYVALGQRFSSPTPESERLTSPSFGS